MGVKKMINDWEVCKISGKLRHKCKPEDVEIKNIEHRKETFVHYDYCNICGFEPPPPPAIPQLPEKFRVANIKQKLGYPVYVSAFFVKDIGINFGEYSREYAYALIDKIAEEGLSNTVRMFAYLAYPNVCHYPHPKIGARKWDVNVIDETWWDFLLDIIIYCIERGLHVRLILWDEHSYNRRWNWHWANPDCNAGFRRADGKLYEMYPDRYGHLKWINYILKGAECTPKEYVGYETNMEYHLGMWDEIIFRLKSYPLLWPHITPETNELDSGDHGHNFLGDFLRQRGIPRWRRITSPRGGPDWINKKKSINRFWLPEIHGIRGLEDYEEVRDITNCRILPSGDGFGAEWHLGYHDLRKFVRQALRDKCYGIGGNNWLSNIRPGSIQEWFDALDYESGEIMMEELDIFLNEQ